MNREDSIVFTGVSKKFIRSQLILDNLNLAIKKGEFVSLLGPSGCGKSTILRLMAQLETPTRGSIQLKSELSTKNLGYVFQEPHLLPWRSVKENILLPLLIKNYPFEDGAFNTLVKQVRLEDSLDKYPHQLSGGMKMRVSLARALISNPKWLLLDEPFSALDDFSRQKLQDDLRVLWKARGLTVVFVTHSVSEALYLSSRVLMFSIKPAKVVADKKLNFSRDRNQELKSSLEFNKEVEYFSHKYGENYV